MRVVFMGTPEFAVPSLLTLARAHDVVAVYTAPDRPAGRGLRPRASAVKAAAAELGLAVAQPASLRDPSEIAVLAALQPDVVAVAAYGLVLPPAALSVARLGPVNVHASLLPRWRGAAPVERAILAGDELAGVSIMRMEEGLDTGPYALQVAVPVGDATADELRGALADAGARALASVVELMAAATVQWTVQDESRVTYAAKVFSGDVALTPELTVAQASRRVRASGRTAPSRVSLGGGLLTVEALVASSVSVAPGVVVIDRDGLHIGLADGAATLVRVRPAGRASMDGAGYARGARLGPDACWGPAL